MHPHHTVRRYLYLLPVIVFLIPACNTTDPVESTSSLSDGLTVVPVKISQPFAADYVTTFEVVPPLPPPVTNLETTGHGTGIAVGQSSLFVQSQITGTVFPFTETGTAVITSAEGGELAFSFQGTIEPIDAQNLAFEGEFVFTGGNGRFIDASGGGSYSGRTNQISQEGEFSLGGIITLQRGRSPSRESE